MERLWNQIANDKKEAAQRGDIEKLYIIELAKLWIGMRAKDKDELWEKISALAAILNTSEFQNTMSISKEIYIRFDIEKAKKAADGIVKLSESVVYAENAPIAGYQLLDKFKKAQTYQTDAFITHANMMMDLYEYLKTLMEDSK